MSAARGGAHLLVLGVQGLPRSPGSCALHPLRGAQDQLFLLLDQLFKLCPLWGPVGRRPRRGGLCRLLPRARGCFDENWAGDVFSSCIR